ncbi:MAG: metallophosphoesterase family protein [Coriobacteriales bacterium]|jgi:putative phosphoesterase|nr:metallophosphoesterase family protein [Coriobacteriales bacterium]
MKVGIISDTHGRLPAAAFKALEGCDAIIHAGDIGSPEVLYELEAIAPVTAVLGNCDQPEYGRSVRAVAAPRIGGVRFKVVHRFRDIGKLPEDVGVIVHGHTHLPAIERSSHLLIINPGSPTRPRGDNWPSVALVEIEDGVVTDARVVELT